MLQPGDRVGRYEIQRRLGRGGTADVYVAHDPYLGRMVALKMFAGDVDETDAAERFFREARAAAALNHVNIVTIHDVGDFEAQPYIVMEYIQGETLERLIRSKADLSLHDRLRIMEELCAGVGYAHGFDVIHRDIKPANLIVERSGRLRILDFGIARMRGSSQSTGLVGTPGYMAPEQIRGEPLDKRVDLFSVGVVCYELLAFTSAFPGDSFESVTHRILTEEPASLSGLVPEIPAELVAAVERGLKKNPSERFSGRHVFWGSPGGAQETGRRRPALRHVAADNHRRSGRAATQEHATRRGAAGRPIERWRGLRIRGRSSVGGAGRADPTAIAAGGGSPHRGAGPTAPRGLPGCARVLPPGADARRHQCRSADARALVRRGIGSPAGWANGRRGERRARARCPDSRRGSAPARLGSRSRCARSEAARPRPASGARRTKTGPRARDGSSGFRRCGTGRTRSWRRRRLPRRGTTRTAARPPGFGSQGNRGARASPSRGGPRRRPNRRHTAPWRLAEGSCRPSSSRVRVRNQDSSCRPATAAPGSGPSRAWDSARSCGIRGHSRPASGRVLPVHAPRRRVCRGSIGPRGCGVAVTGPGERHFANGTSAVW